MSKRQASLLIEDMFECSNKILTYTKDLTFDEFIKNLLIVDAVIRNMEIIGEAAKRLPAKIKENNPQIDWQRIRGFRNRIVHNYFGIDYYIVWLVKEVFLPDLVAKLAVLQL
jgi:uncharacterized protein with HEPN domain